MPLKRIMHLLTPHFRGRVAPGSRLYCFRWLASGFDFAQMKDGTLLLQLGRRPVKYVCLLPKNTTSLPNFLYSSKWKPCITLGRLRFGVTRKPLPLGTIFRSEKCSLQKTGALPPMPHGTIRAKARSTRGQKGVTVSWESTTSLTSARPLSSSK